MEQNRHRRIFAQRLRGLMNRHQPERMTLQGLADRISELRPHDPHGKGWVSHKIAGRQDVTLDELVALADIFGTTVSYLVGESNLEHRLPGTLDDPDIPDSLREAIEDLLAGHRARRSH